MIELKLIFLEYILLKVHSVFWICSYISFISFLLATKYYPSDLFHP